jgi:hypothetical protein
MSLRRTDNFIISLYLRQRHISLRGTGPLLRERGIRISMVHSALGYMTPEKFERSLENEVEKVPWN